jgi:hypothetical protein
VPTLAAVRMSFVVQEPIADLRWGSEPEEAPVAQSARGEESRLRRRKGKEKPGRKRGQFRGNATLLECPWGTA